MTFGHETLIHGTSRRGYTGHSTLGTMELVYVSGRLQDAITGRFLSLDPTVPGPGFKQMFKRYLYVNN